MGTPLISTEYLKKLINNNFNIIGVYTQPPSPKGRGMIVQNSPVHDEALKKNIPVFLPHNFIDQKIIDFELFKEKFGLRGTKITGYWLRTRIFSGRN